MRRPCFALAVLLGWMATSVLVVGKANSQPLRTAMVGIPGPARAGGGLMDALVIGLVLGQTPDADGECGEDGCSGLAANGDSLGRGTGSSFAVYDGSRSPGYWFAVVPTGYDSGYDFAMLEGRYLDVVPSRTDIEHSLAMERPAIGDGANAYLTDGPTNLMSCEDFDYCLDGERPTEWVADTVVASEQIPQEEVELTEDWLFEACWPMVADMADSSPVAETPVAETPVAETPVAETPVAETPVAETPVVETPVVETSEAETAADWTWLVEQAQESVHQWWLVVREHPAANRMWNAMNRVEPVAVIDAAPVEVSTGELVPDATPNWGAVDFGEEVLLIAAADSLDQLGSALQATAQHLRCWAADRIVLKGERRRVAQKSDRE